MSGPSSDSTAERPLVSVVIPAYNHARFLRESVDAALSQTYKPLEVIVVDNGSTDETPNLDLGTGVRLIRLEKNAGPSAARNAGVREARGEVVAFLDGDDLMSADCVAVRAQMLQADPSAGMVVGSLRIVDEAGAVLRIDPLTSPPRMETTYEQALVEMSCPTCGLLVRKSAFEAIGGFDESLWVAEDTDLLLRMAAKFRVLVDNEPRADYRQVAGSISRNYELWFDSYRQMLAKNEAVAPDRALFRRLTSPSFRERTCNMIFGKLAKDSSGGKLPRLMKILSSRPALVPYLLYWMGRAAGNRVARAFGRGPLTPKTTIL